MAGNILLETARAWVEELSGGAGLLRFDGQIDSATAKWAADALKQLEDSMAAFVVTGCSAYDKNEIDVLISREDWTALEEVSVNFQYLTDVINKLQKPVVVALSGEATDFGIEAALSADGVCEAGAMIGFAVKKSRFSPMGGGLAELALRTYAIGADVMGCDIVPFLKRIFGQIYMGKPCQGLAEAAAKGITFTMASSCAEEELLEKAKEKALFLSSQGYSPRETERSVLVTGTTGAAALEITSVNLHAGGFIPDEAFKTAADIARVLCGGDVPKGTIVSETQLRKLEREAFLKSCKRVARKEETA